MHRAHTDRGGEVVERGIPDAERMVGGPRIDDDVDRLSGVIRGACFTIKGEHPLP